MQRNGLDSLPKLVAQGKIDKNQAMMKVLEIIYTNPARFGLQTMDEDERSEFLLEALPKFEAMLKRHNERISPFGAYLFHSIPGMKITWAKKRIEDARGERVMKNSMEEAFKSGEERTLLEVATPSRRDAQSRRIRTEIFSDASTIATQKKEEFRDIGKIFAKHGRATIAQNRLHEKRSALVLALKSAWYMDDAKIEKISDFCGCPKEIFMEKVHNVRNKLVEKSERHETLVQKRDKAWFFICKYREEISRMERGGAEYEKWKRKLNYQLNVWKRKNRLLQKCNYRVSADNETVAKALNVSAHKVSTYLNYARRMAQEKEAVS